MNVSSAVPVAINAIISVTAVICFLFVSLFILIPPYCILRFHIMDYSNIIQYKQSGYIDLDTRQGGARIHRNSRDKQLAVKYHLVCPSFIILIIKKVLQYTR